MTLKQIRKSLMVNFRQQKKQTKVISDKKPLAAESNS